MTKVEAIIREEKLEAIQHDLDQMGCAGITVTAIKGAGQELGQQKSFRGHVYRETYVARYKIEVVVPDPLVEEVIWTIRNAGITGEVGDGRIFLIPVTDAIRIRTGVRGNEAL